MTMPQIVCHTMLENVFSQSKQAPAIKFRGGPAAPSADLGDLQPSTGRNPFWQPLGDLKSIECFLYHVRKLCSFILGS